MRILTLILSLVCINLSAETTSSNSTQLKTLSVEATGLLYAKMGLSFLTGEGVARDYNAAYDLFYKSAQLGNTNAQAQLGFLYLEGKGVAQSETEAFKWFLISAQNGNVIAQRIVADCYEAGRGTQSDCVEAYAYYNLAGRTDPTARELLNKLESKMTLSQIETGQKVSSELQAHIGAKIAESRAKSK